MADVNGTNGNDVLFFQGTLAQLTVTLVNPYSSEEIFVDEEKNINTASYEGFSGIDTLFLTNVGDALFTVDDLGAQMLFNIERIIAGDGGDVIILASDTVNLGGTLVEGGLSGDILWGNVGDDTLNGFDGDDNIDGGPGNDTVNGQNDNDKLKGGAGNDTINGGSGADIMRGGDGNDTLQFTADIVFPGGVFAQNQGSPGIAGTLETKSANGTNGTFDLFDGGDGFDTLVMTAGNDTLYLYDPFHTFHPEADGLRVMNVEQINAGAGNDIVDFTSADYAYGDIVMNGGDGNDLLWASVGEDTINGDNGNDSLWGGVGDDLLNGGAGDDVLIGGPDGDSGAITVTTVTTTVTTVQSHDFSNEVVFPNLVETVDIMDLVPPGTDALGIAAGDLSVDFATTAEITFYETGAGYNNSLGFYNIAQDGTIQSVRLAFPNVKDVAPGAAATIELPGAPDTDFGFFIISDGARKNDFSDLDLENGTLSFVYMRNSAEERLATIHDPAEKIWLVYNDGVQEVFLRAFNGPHGIYHTTLRGGDTNLNHDGEVHVLSGLIEDGDTTRLRIGFEDLNHTGDADYNDVVFDLVVNSVTTTTTTTETVITHHVDDNDTLHGGAGNDTLNGGVGADVLYGEAGSDRFVFDVLDGFADTVKDFTGGMGGDILDIADILQGYDAMTDLLDDFVRLVGSGGNTELQVNADGDAGGIFAAIAIIEGGVGGATLADLAANGNLVTS